MPTPPDPDLVALATTVVATHDALIVAKKVQADADTAAAAAKAEAEAKHVDLQNAIAALEAAIQVEASA